MCDTESSPEELIREILETWGCRGAPPRSRFAEFANFSEQHCRMLWVEVCRGDFNNARRLLDSIESKFTELSQANNVGNVSWNDPVSRLNISLRLANILEKNGIFTVADLASSRRADLMEIRNFSITYWKQVQEALKDAGFIRDEVP